LPAPVPRYRRGGPARDGFELEIETVTPILGGGPTTRNIDETDIIRVPSIRGHLRFWWRALQHASFASPAELFRAEAHLWGRAADDIGGRSSVEVSVSVGRQSRIDPSDVNANATDGYALWPARRGEHDPAPAPRRLPGVRFRLNVSAAEPVLAEIRNAVRAWILFGGYGSRSRRGVGSLTVVDRYQGWLPSVEDPGELEPAELREEVSNALTHLFGRNVFGGGPPRAPFPSLSGASLLIGAPFARQQAKQAWEEALHWVRDFRQQPGFAREPGRPRPGRSRWPEADKLRHLNRTFDHDTRYDDRPAWPRAPFGLPIVGRFVGKGVPPPFELIWRDPKGGEHERAASPLIVKALPLAQGFCPCALWLARSYPEGYVAVRGRADSAALPDFLGSESDRVKQRQIRAPIAGHASVKDAFIGWVARKPGLVQVAP
jgi:CRISPR-associated protein Cmr1